MKEKNLFDILGNSEDDSMKRLADKCPEITDAQLDRLLKDSERKYNMKKKDIEGNRTEKVKDITISETSVSGVERVKRPVWLAPLCTAASLILIAGIAIGSTALLHRNHGSPDGGDGDPAITVTTVSDTVTTVTTSENTNTATTVTDDTAVTNSSAAASTGADAETTSTTPVQTNSDVFYDSYYGSIATDLYKKHDSMIFFTNFMDKARSAVTINEYADVAAAEEKGDIIWFSTDHYDDHYALDLSSDPIEWKNIDRVYFVRVDDSRFSSLDDIRKYVRETYSADNEKYKFFDKQLSVGFDYLNIGDKISKDHMYDYYIEYKGKLYMNTFTPQAGYVGSRPYEELPVIITDKTDSSYTAYVPDYLLDPGLEIKEEDLSCVEMKIVLDPETNNWCIENINYHDYSIYKELAAKIS